jgi:hypothetical protein
MNTHLLALLVTVPGLMALNSAALCTPEIIGNPATGSYSPGPALQGKDLKQSDKQSRDEVSARNQEDYRLYKRMVKAKPQDVQAWRLLGWHAAYNLSVDFDDIKDRYGYVKQGIEHLVEGLTHNPTNAALYWDIGFYLRDRIGRGENRVPIRELFRKDKEFHQLLARQVDFKGVAGPGGLPDNFLVAQRWFEKTLEVIKKQGLPPDLLKFNTLILNSYPAMCQRAYARAIEDEGHFGETAADAWKQALKMWEILGEQEFVAENGTKYLLKNNEFGRALVNYDYWKQRCQVEQTEPLLRARRAVYQAEKYLNGFKGTERRTWEKNLAMRPADFTEEARDRAKQLFNEAFRACNEVYKEHPWLVENEEEMIDVIERYKRLVLNGEKLPDDFPLRHYPDLLPRRP